MVDGGARVAEEPRGRASGAENVRLVPMRIEVCDHEGEARRRTTQLAAMVDEEDSRDRSVRHVAARLTFGRVASLRVFFSVPAYWPAHSFGGPIEVMRRLAEGLVERGHDLRVFTTSLTGLDAPGSRRSRSALVHGVPVTHLATPVHFRWMGL